MKNILFLFVAILLIFSCKPDGTENRNVGLSEEYKTALDKLSTEPGKESANNYLQEVRNAIAISDDEVKIKDYLMKGLAVAEEYKMGATAIGYLMPLLKNYPNSPQKAEYMAKLASALSDVGKKIPGDILIDAYLNQYPNGLP